MRAIIIEDEPLSVAELRTTLAEVAPQIEVVAKASSVAEAAAVIAGVGHDLIFMDIHLGDGSGFDIFQRTEISVPVIFITAKSAVKDRVLGLRLGADDYITKPFAAEELVARMESVLRRTGRGGRELRAYDVVLDTVDRVARQNGEPLDLRRREFDLLELLMRNRGAALYRDVIFERVWGELPDTESLRTVDTHIARLRKKLGWTDKQIETVFKIGYRLRKE